MVNWNNIFEAEMKSILRKINICNDIGDVEGAAYWTREMDARQNRGNKPL